MLRIKAEVNSVGAYRCLDCRQVQKEEGNCIYCYGSNMKNIKVHTIKPKSVISETKGKINNDKHKNGQKQSISTVR